MAKATSIFKYRAFNKSSIELLLNRELWFAKPEALNDPFECQLSYESVLDKTWKLHQVSENYKYAVEKKLENHLIKVGICAFSKTQKNQLMWTHYSDEHRGFCIGFNKQILKSSDEKYNSIDVKYQSELPYKEIIERLEYYQKTSPRENSVTDIVQDIMYSVIGTKHTNWGYEREVRLVKETSGSIEFSPEQVNSITFGLRMAERDKKTLKLLVQGDEWKHIKFYQAEKSTNKYGLVFKRV